MANTQINISANGTKTLATAGKYCDRNIDVNVSVPVPSGYIKPSGSKTITENGTHDVTQYASAVVDVAGKPTQFTNLYDPANVVLKKYHSYSSSGGQSVVTDNYVNYIVIPYNHVENEPLALRVRGLSIPVRERFSFVMYNEREADVVTWGNLHSATTKTVDEYGDVVMTFSNSSTFVTAAWKYLVLNFQYIGENAGVSAAKTGPIITINEPIGNGGHAG